MKSFISHLMEEVGGSPSNNVAGRDNVDMSPVDRKTLNKSTFAGATVYDVDAGTYKKFTSGPKKSKHSYKRLLKDEALVTDIRSTIKSNPKGSILLSSKEYGGSMVFLKKGRGCGIRIP